MAFLDSAVLLASPDPEEAHHDAMKAGAEVFFTLNVRDFQALARPGDPAIQSPGCQ